MRIFWIGYGKSIIQLISIGIMLENWNKSNWVYLGIGGYVVGEIINTWINEKTAKSEGEK